MKGLVIEKKTGSFIILTPSGEYKKITGTTKMNIGQEVKINNTFTMARLASLAAAIFVIITLLESMFIIPGQNRVYGYVTLDINPSVKFAINKNHIVLSAYEYNDEARQVLSDIEYSGKDIDAVLADFTKEAIEDKYINKDKENYVVVSFYPVNSDEKSKLNLDDITKKQRDVIQSSGQKVEMDTFIVDEETRKEAEKEGISPGKLKGVKNGISENSNMMDKETKKQIKQEEKEKKSINKKNKKKDKTLGSSKNKNKTFEITPENLNEDNKSKTKSNQGKKGDKDKKVESKKEKSNKNMIK